MTKIVFLDIDGVLNTQGDKNLIENTFEKYKLNNLINLILNTNSSLVIISDRRLIKEERDTIEKVFDEYEIIVNYLNYERTHKKRSDEILFYLSNHECENYVILDDVDLGYSEDEELSSHFINTYIGGFTKYYLKKAIELLNAKTTYQVVVNNRTLKYNSLTMAKEKVIDIIKKYMEYENQAFSDEIPFNFGYIFSGLYSDRIINDEEIIIYKRIQMLMEDLIYSNNYIEYIDKNYECHRSSGDDTYNCYIIKNIDEIILILETVTGQLQTNMFNMKEEKEYFFHSKEMIVVEHEKCRRKFGEVAQIDITIKPIKDIKRKAKKWEK